LALELVGRALGNDVERAADRVAPVQRALRAAQNLGALDVQRWRRGIGHRTGEDAVGIQCDRRIGADAVGESAEAAHRQAVVVAIGEARRETREVLHAVQTQYVAPLARISGDRYGYVLDVHCALFRSNDDLLEYRCS